MSSFPGEHHLGDLDRRTADRAEDFQVGVTGESILVQFALESPTRAFYRDRFIIRTFSPFNMIGGGGVLDAAPAQVYDQVALISS